MFEGVHIEKALWSTLDDMLEYVSCPESLFLFFTLDHQNYSQWLFQLSANWKFTKDFVNSIEQIYGEKNYKIKGKGGIIRLSDNPSSLQK